MRELARDLITVTVVIVLLAIGLTLAGVGFRCAGLETSQMMTPKIFARLFGEHYPCKR